MLDSHGNTLRLALEHLSEVSLEVPWPASPTLVGQSDLMILPPVGPRWVNCEHIYCLGVSFCTALWRYMIAASPTLEGTSGFVILLPAGPRWAN